MGNPGIIKKPMQPFMPIITYLHIIISLKLHKDHIRNRGQDPEKSYII